MFSPLLCVGFFQISYSSLAGPLSSSVTADGHTLNPAGSFPKPPAPSLADGPMPTCTVGSRSRVIFCMDIISLSQARERNVKEQWVIL